MLSPVSEPCCHPGVERWDYVTANKFQQHVNGFAAPTGLLSLQPFAQQSDPKYQETMMIQSSAVCPRLSPMKGEE
jgi:hypothetical protein